MGEADEQKLKLMVVDDEADNLDLLYRTFRRDFEVLIAESGLKALQLLEQEGEMAIIISDQRMPKMNGTEFLSRTVDRFPDTIRILLTGYTDVADLVGAINAGKVFKYITKPWNPDALMTVVLQAAETYRLVKQRTSELNRSLRRESLFNAVTTAIRESLDYQSMLQTIVETIGQTFAADACILHPVESTNGKQARSYRFTTESFCYAQAIEAEQANGPALVQYDDLKTLQAALEQPQIELIHATGEHPYTQLVVPLRYQQEIQAMLTLYKQGESHPWSVEEIQLIEGVAEQAALAISQARLYQRIQQQTQQMKTELAVAQQIQTNLLRQSWPDLGKVKVQAHCRPAREVGGDFFEVFVHPQGDIWLAVGDVSGKGVPAALFMASAISLLRRELSQEVSPEPNIVMSNLNESLVENLVSCNCFITMVLARYSPESRELVCANAGHIYPMVWSRQGAIDQTVNQPIDQPIKQPKEPNYLKVRGVPLGILTHWQAAADRLTLSPSDILLLTSDGITEATVANAANDGHAMLQQSGLWQLLSQQQSEFNLSQIVAQVHSHNSVQEDDQTILSLEVL